MQAVGRQGFGGRREGQGNGRRLGAYDGARALGIDDLAGMCAVILTLTPANFHKSMTAHADHRIWQDVYRTRTAGGGEVYLKLTVIDDVLIVSFKEL